MKVFTVGLDQKPPLEEPSKVPPSPPPGYVTPSPPPSVVMGPEPPIIIRQKSRGYKGCLIVLLSVFLVALFALTLSEIAYNRQRDENFFRLRWAELKHRMGWDYDNWHRWQERVFNMHRAQELQQQPMMFGQQQPQPFVVEQQQVPSTTPTMEAPKVDDVGETQQKVASIADRLQFFRQLLEGIKKQAENMGFDGTMQVSVVQVDPLQSVDEQDNTKSDSFLDGFGEVHQPQQLEPKSKSSSGSGSEETENMLKLRRPCGFFKCENEVEDTPVMQFPSFGTPFRPIRPSIFNERNEDSTVERFFGPKVEVIDIPVNSEEQNPIFRRRFGRILQDLIANRLRQRLENFQQMNNFPPPRPETSPSFQNTWWQPMQPRFPQSFPIGNDVGMGFEHPPQPFQPGQQPPPQFIFFPNPQNQQFPRPRLDNTPIFQGQPQQQQSFIPPEDRIQIEPPTQNFVDWKPWNSDNGNGFMNLNNEGNRGWTHQEMPQQQPQVEQQLPQQPQPSSESNEHEPQLPPQVPVQNAPAPNPAPILDGSTEQKKEDNTVSEDQKPVLPVLAIDPPMPSIAQVQLQPQPSPSIEAPSASPASPGNKENSLESETPFSDIIADELLDSDAFSNEVKNAKGQKEVSPSAPEKVDTQKLDLKPAVEIDGQPIMPKDDTPLNVETSHLNILPIRELQLPMLSIDDHAGESSNVDQASQEDHSPKGAIHDGEVHTEVEFPKISVESSESSKSQNDQVDFPAVKFPMNDEFNNREHNPIFFQVDEPVQQQDQSMMAIEK